MNARVSVKRFCLSVCVLATFLLSSPFLLCAQSAPQETPKGAAVRVPFVGCESDGQLGLVKMPTEESRVVDVSAEAAQRLAFYKSEYGFGTLAPRGWYCFGTYGSNGLTLYVSPEPIKGDDVLSPNWKGFTGPAIQITELSGNTFGKFAVARTVARVFPERSRFVEKVVHEGFEPESAFPSGPYPSDKLTYRNRNIVEFQTAPNAEGLGTDSRLVRNGDAIKGVAILFGEEPNLLQLSVRLVGQDSGLTEAIIEQTVRDTMRLRDTEAK